MMIENRRKYDTKYVTQKELAWYFNLTDKSIRNLTKDYGLFKKEQGKRLYNLQECVAEYVNFLKDNQRKTDSKRDLDSIKCEHEIIKKEISNLRLKHLKNNSHNSKDVEEFLTNMLIDFKNNLVSIPSKVAPLIIGEDDINKVVNIIENEVFRALDVLSEYDPMKINSDNINLFEDEEGDNSEDTEN